MLTLTQETLIRLAEVRRRIPGRGRTGRLHFSTILRWVTRGVGTPAGRVKLEAARIGNTWMTSEEALVRFVEATTAPYAMPAARVEQPAKSAARRRHDQRVEERLREFGI
jgi:hypothetical protein